MQLTIYVTFLLLIIYTSLLLYYRQSWLSIPTYNIPTTLLNPTLKISIIIPARNEEGKIIACLNSIINQNYPKHLFEILVVDDFSTDNTANNVLKFSDQNVKLISLKKFVGDSPINSYKKKAIEIAIGQSTGELIITTDADCIVPSEWLQTIAAFYQGHKPDFIVMPVAITNSKNSFIEIFQSLDFMTLQGITGASVYKKIHSMCNGANLAYTKKAFIAVNGFAGIDNIASGDDMLLMHKIFKHNPTGVAFLKSKKVIVATQPVQNAKAFFNQRIRWASKADKYDDKRIFAVLVLVYLFNCLLLFLPIVAIFSSQSKTLFQTWLITLAIKTIVELFFLFPVATFFNTKKLLWWFVIMQPFHIVYTVIAGWLGKFGKYNWKGRNVK